MIRYGRLDGAAPTSAKRTVIDRAIRLAQYVSAFGSIEGLALFFKNRVNRREFSLSISTVPGKFVIRRSACDLCVFDQVFVEQQYRLEFSLEPNFIVDAGANVGFSSAYFAMQYPRAKIVALEPEPSNFVQLKKNVGALKNVTCVQAALWSDTSRLCIQDPSAQSHAFRVQVASSVDSNVQFMQAVTIDEIMRNHGVETIDLLKIDIEGAEKEVFSDPTKWIDRVRVIMIELHDNIKPGCSKTFWNALRDRDFTQYLNGEITTVLLGSPR
jgi:FkbM family methyltransferase